MFHPKQGLSKVNTRYNLVPTTGVPPRMLSPGYGGYQKGELKKRSFNNKMMNGEKYNTASTKIELGPHIRACM